MKFIVVTNNNSLIESEKDFSEVIDYVFVDGNFLDVLVKVRDLVHMGHKLISHPLGASIRIMFSPVRSILLSDEKYEPDILSMEVIESSTEKYKATMQNRNIDFRNKKDYEFIDIELLKSAINESKMFK